MWMKVKVYVGAKTENSQQGISNMQQQRVGEAESDSQISALHNQQGIVNEGDGRKSNGIGFRGKDNGLIFRWREFTMSFRH